MEDRTFRDLESGNGNYGLGTLKTKLMTIKAFDLNSHQNTASGKTGRFRNWIVGFTKKPISLNSPASNPHFLIPLMTLSLWGLPILSGLAAKASDIPLKVGVVQRFGDEPTDKLTLKAAPDDQLTVKFLGGDMQPKTKQLSSLKLEIVNKPLQQPQIEEYVVLSNHGTFETAEDSANKWREKGIEVEVAKPDRWQVWAKRSVYQTPLLRRLLLASIKAKGDTTAYIDTNVVTEVPHASFVIGNYRYHRREIDITAGKNLIWVSKGENNRRTRLYPGSLRIQPNAYGDYTLVNQVPLESYLRGVVPHEIGAGARYSTVAAQSIIARTYALRNRRRFNVDGYELCADTHCQVYFGINQTNPVADRAIAATKGLVLTYNNELVDALYSAATGGISAPFSDVWNGSERPYLKAVVDSPYSLWNLSQKSLADEQNFREFMNLKQGFNETDNSYLFRWKYNNSLKQVTSHLQRYLKKTKHPLANFTTIEHMEVVERSPAGRVLKMAVTTDRGILELSKNEARSAFGPPRSTLFYVDPIYDKANQTLKGFVFVGGGFGHGVGFSQHGSQNLAKLGWSAEKILSFYYPGTQIQPLNNSIIFWQNASALVTP
ncbi:MAG: SpoIID/LytB domain-containing protein [Moorea sp. SIO1F2]|uniref:SpoIID/LytB domain-containing protein n=2 Tax=Moorena TaxID=1155738 RepID=UPI0013BB32C1|nr:MULTISPECIES: SpoIID/LytB domain-containing protein [unclassified Moorena]NEO07552.1 SpoIID/LytB domain-containing protein [Moorena sp. SIO3I8]NEO18025.1 SpoIID/LytB domain-containing protein [Moorena sp. SIO4A5]NEP22923.1 SpoIID/LytB domain-containing protein [Moorena sp. SIO3I6]NEQ58700.1 SpoIID/LytB domain-containing protein [Moorena sp. SIO4A1]NET83958.1 SpoIID/LytB domain-containing protein [Moorena sp. SIO1F2]